MDLTAQVYKYQYICLTQAMWTTATAIWKSVNKAEHNFTQDQRWVCNKISFSN